MIEEMLVPVLVAEKAKQVTKASFGLSSLWIFLLFFLFINLILEFNFFFIF